MSAATPGRGDPILRLISHPRRRAILMALHAGAMTFLDLTTGLGVSRQSLSGQLQVLRLGGLVESERHGVRKSYRLTDRGCRAVVAVIEQSGPI